MLKCAAARRELTYVRSGSDSSFRTVATTATYSVEKLEADPDFAPT
jgi:hypothetical protein